jgi:hypothetical protein
MIERNIGNVERIVRLFFGVVFAAVVLMQPSINTFVEWFVIIVAVSLMLNGIFSRCYLWYILDVNTREKADSCTPSNSVC